MFYAVAGAVADIRAALRVPSAMEWRSQPMFTRLYDRIGLSARIHRYHPETVT